PSLLVKLTMAGSIYEQRMCSQRKRPRFLQSLLKRWYTHAGMDRVQRLVIAALVLMAGIYLVGVRYHNRERSNGNVRAPQTASVYVDSWLPWDGPIVRLNNTNWRSNPILRSMKRTWPWEESWPAQDEQQRLGC